MTRFDPSGTTVLITGASSGFGAEFARRFAERGANLVLVARREERLAALAAELAASFGTVSTVVALDLSLPDATAILTARLQRDGITVDSLINNAGFGSHGLFATIDADRITNEVTVNVSTLVALTRAFLPTLTGALVNVASNAAFQPVPRMAVYGATKAFVLSFTEAIWWESKGTGLRVTALCPGPSGTEFADVAHNEDAMTGTWQTPEQIVASAFRALDRRTTPPSTITSRANAILAKSVGFVPRRLVLNMAGRLGRPGKSTLIRSRDEFI